MGLPFRGGVQPSSGWAKEPTRYPGWMKEAKCHGAGSEDFFQLKPYKAKKICADCPVWVICLAEGLDEPYGVWGGFGINDRVKYREELAWYVKVHAPPWV